MSPRSAAKRQKVNSRKVDEFSRSTEELVTLVTSLNGLLTIALPDLYAALAASGLELPAPRPIPPVEIC